MAKSSLKLLAQKAKNRLKNVSNNIDQKDSARPAIKRVGLANHEYAVIATKIKIEDDPIYNKVIKMLSKNPDTHKPLGELIETEIYNNLNETEKQKYILNLSSRYKAIKNKFMQT